MLNAQAAKWCVADPLRQKFTPADKKEWTKAERSMYKSAYELGGDARATAVLRRYFLEQKKEAEGAEGAAEGAAGAPAAAGSSSAAPEARPIAVAPPVPAAVAPIASVAPIAPKPLVERTPGQLLIAGSAAWEDVGKKTLSPEEALILHTFHRALVGTPIALIATGPSACHVFALTPTGTAFAWGRNSNGQLGLGHTNPTSSPSPLKQLSTDKTDSKIVAIACGKAHTLFVTGKGKLFACGSNASAQLGIGTGAKTGSYVDAPKAVKWPAGREACRVACGADFSVATDSEGHLYSWGHPQCGQLGHGSTGECLEKSGRVDYDFRTEPGLVTYTEGSSRGVLPPIGPIACGDRHTVAVTTSGEVFTWGFGGYGRLGHANQNDLLRPQAINFVHKAKIVEVAAGGTCTYAKTLGGATFFWGRTKSTGEATMYPKAVADLHGWSTRSFACGHTSSFVAADRSLIAWGPSPTYGELGYGPEGPKSSTTPKLVDDLTGALVEQVAAGYACSALIVNVADEASGKALQKLPLYEDVLSAAAASGVGRKAGDSAKKGNSLSKLESGDEEEEEGKEVYLEPENSQSESEGNSQDDDDEEDARHKGKKRAAPAQAKDTHTRAKARK